MNREFMTLLGGLKLLEPYVDAHSECLAGWADEVWVGYDIVLPQEVREGLKALGWQIDRPDAKHYAVWGAK